MVILYTHFIKKYHVKEADVQQSKWTENSQKCYINYEFIYLNINQLDALNFIMSLLYACTCFEHYVFITRRSKLYYTTFGTITPVGGRPVHSPLSICALDGHL